MTTKLPADIPDATFRLLMSNLPTSVTAIAAQTAGGPRGLVVGTFTSVSMEPKLVGFMPTCTSRSWAMVREVGRFTASVLASDQKDICTRLAGRSEDKFDGVAMAAQDDPAIVAVANCVAWLDCDIVEEYPAGDHSFVLASPRLMRVERTQAHPLVFFRRAYHRTSQVEDLIAPSWD